MAMSRSTASKPMPTCSSALTPSVASSKAAVTSAHTGGAAITLPSWRHRSSAAREDGPNRGSPARMSRRTLVSTAVIKRLSTADALDEVVHRFAQLQGAVHVIERRMLERLVPDELALGRLEVQDDARGDPQPLPDRLRNRDLALLGDDGFHTRTVGIPTHCVKKDLRGSDGHRQCRGGIRR